jgi:hypothetical protein
VIAGAQFSEEFFRIPIGFQSSKMGSLLLLLLQKIIAGREIEKKIVKSMVTMVCRLPCLSNTTNTALSKM